MTIAESASTSAIDPHERADYWTHLIGSYQCSLGFRFPDSTDFRGHTSLRRTDTYQLVGWESDAVTYIRSPKLIRSDPDSDYRLLVPLTGTLTFRNDDDQGSLYPGSACLVSTDEPFAASMSDGSHGLIVTISREEIRHRLNRVVPPPRPLDLRTGLGGVAGAVVGTLYSQRAALTDLQFDTVAEQLVDLLCMQILGEPASSPGQLVQVEATARRYIRTHAADPDLTGAQVAAALGWSLRQLQLAFSNAGTTPSEVIREQRLQLARERLRNPAYRHRSIADIAADLGFGSASSFTKAFRRRFHSTPGQLRD
ncbi:AraC family transcriptional regulator [Nocardia spumae]|uniref:AraC family transcriptional regulator n=1 Tax=Nocardia spumae TaxID=2887190 RepID=UPI001D13D3B4|nr:AraC family transcriptional regulator [Nocardia spumae]